jgi:hypothetical protein
MASVLASNKSLRAVVINDNLIESEGAITILENAFGNRDCRLRTLSLKRNLLSDTKVDRLVQLLNARSSLAKFEVAGNPVAGHRMFQQVRNTLEVT